MSERSVPVAPFSADGIDLKAIRQELGLSQAQFARLLGFSVRAIQSCEQGWRKPGASLERSALLLLMANRNPAGAALSPTKSEFTRLPVGAEGVARSILRPSGRAEFGGELHDVITMGQFVDPGTRVRVVAVEGARIVVEPF